MNRKYVAITARTKTLSDEELLRLEEIWKKIVRDYSPEAEIEICFIHGDLLGKRIDNFHVQGNFEKEDSWSALCEDLFFAPMLLGL